MELPKEILDKIEVLTSDIFYFSKPDIRKRLIEWTIEILPDKEKK